MKRLLALGLAISLGGCAYRPSYSSYGYIARTAIPTGRHRPRAIRATRRRRAIRPLYQSPPPAGSYQSEPFTPSNDNQPIILNPPRPNTGS